MKTVVTSVLAVLCLALPASAMAGTASLDLQQSDLGPGVMLENLSYRAASGEHNRLTVSFDGSSTYTLTDSAGITPGTRCSRPNAADSTRVTCLKTAGSRLGGVLVKLGDENDRATVSGRGAVVLGGDGSDVLKGSAFADTLSAGASAIKNARAHTKDHLSGRGGTDILRGSRGDNRIDGGAGQDAISAGRGDDVIKARDSRVDQVRCGGGFDRAKLDSADFLADRCRAVSRPGTPAATPVELFTSGLNANVVVGCPRDALLEHCVGAVRISRGKRSFGRKRFDIGRGHKSTKSFRLPADIRGQIGPNGGPRVKVTVRSRSAPRRTSTFFVRPNLPPPGD
jgi:hypothetical protein